MKERPILFSAPMVRAILAGQKTQTRRVVKLPPWVNRKEPDLSNAFPDMGSNVNPFGAPGEGYLHVPCDDDDSVQRVHSPYGVPGDRLWVRESFSYWHGLCSADVGEPVHYWADGSPEDGDWTRPKPSIHMPRWASRLTLEVTGVRVERLQLITEGDATAEGFTSTPAEKWWQGYRDDERCGLMAQQHRGPTPPDWMVEPHLMSGRDPLATTAVESFESTWNYLNAERGFGWAANPWVWAIEFRATTPPNGTSTYPTRTPGIRNATPNFDGSDGTRTRNLVLAKDLRSQLRHRPETARRAGGIRLQTVLVAQAHSLKPHAF